MAVISDCLGGVHPRGAAPAVRLLLGPSSQIGVVSTRSKGDVAVKYRSAVDPGAL